MKKFRYSLITIFFLGFTVFFLICTIVREKGHESFQENRTLAKMPVLSGEDIMNGEYVNDINRSFTDHFAARSYWIAAKSMIDSSIGERTVNNVYITDSMLLDVSKPDDLSTNNAAACVNKFLETYDGTVYFAAIPTSAGVYEELLPEHLTYDSEKDRIVRLYTELSPEIRKIDAYNILKMLNDNYIYYRNDSKWTSYGAYCVYRTVIQKLGFLPVSYDKYTIEHISSEFRGNLYNKSQYDKIKADIIDIYTYSEGGNVIECSGYDSNGNPLKKRMYEKQYINTNDMYKLYLGEEMPYVEITTDVNNEKKILIIKDEYANCFIPFLTQHYSKITIVSPECLDEKMSSFVNTDDYEQTLFLFGIEGLYNNDSLCTIN